MRSITSLISGALLLFGIAGLAGMAVVRIHASLSGIDAAKRSDASQIGDYILQSQASHFIVSSYLGILGLFIAYWLIIYTTNQRPFYKRPLLIFATIYVLSLLINFSIFYVVHQ